MARLAAHTATSRIERGNECVTVVGPHVRSHRRDVTIRFAVGTAVVIGYHY